MAFILFDEHSGLCQPVGEVRLPSVKATVRDLIRARVELEVERNEERCGALQADRGTGHAAPGEFGLGGMFARGSSTRRDLDALALAAEEAFVSGRFFLLLNDRQAESLDEAVDLASTGEATFLLITPLQGG